MDVSNIETLEMSPIKIYILIIYTMVVDLIVNFVVEVYYTANKFTICFSYASCLGYATGFLFLEELFQLLFSCCCFLLH